MATSVDPGDELRRFWFDFELPVEPTPPGPGVTLDGGSALSRYLGRGIGVTGYDEQDALMVVADWLIDGHVLADRSDLPAVSSVVAAPDVSALTGRQLGNPAWRGVWSPPDNRGGPRI